MGNLLAVSAGNHQRSLVMTDSVLRAVAKIRQQSLPRRIGAPMPRSCLAKLVRDPLLQDSWATMT